MEHPELRGRCGNRGMTLVELLLVMAILSVVMMAVVSLYVPTHQSTVTQTQITDVQENLRLALRTMTTDLMTAGFLAVTHPIAFSDVSYGSSSLASHGTVSNTDFIIRTRAITHDFARVAGISAVTLPGGGDGFRLTVTDPDMVAHFPVGSKVRLFEPITSEEIISGTGTAAARVYTVEATAANSFDITKTAALNLTDITAETVVLRVSDANQPALQTIRYRFNAAEGALERIINDDDGDPANDSRQVLARNLDAVNFAYFPNPLAANDRVLRVDIELTGQTRALKNDAISGEKTRTIKTSVKLRNIY